MTILKYRKVCLTAVVAWMLVMRVVDGFSQDLKSTSNRADYIVIAPSLYLPLAERLASFRSMNDVYVTMAVSFDSVLAQFGSGSYPDSALRGFIQYAIQTWQEPVPKYFVLAGNINTIPSHHEAENSIDTAYTKYDSLYVDHWFVEGSPNELGYGMAQVSLGRLPAWDSTGLSVMIEKQIKYETTSPSSWWSRCIGLADWDTMAFDMFEWNLRDLQSILSSVWSDTFSVHIDSTSQQHLDSLGFRDVWNQGASIIVYCGHANPYTLSATRFFTTWAVDSLNNENRLPFCFFGGCDLRFDPQYPSSIPVHLLEEMNAGAVGCILSTGATFETRIINLYHSLFSRLVSDPNQTVGEAFTSAKNSCPWELTRRITFLGDPAIRIHHPPIGSIVENLTALSADFALYQNYPNPFNPSTKIRFALKNPFNVSLVVLNALGQQVAILVNGEMEAGYHEVRFDGTNVASGVYFCRMLAGTFVSTKKMLLMK
jgi:hypothetical protein